MLESKFNSLLRAELRLHHAHVDQIETGLVARGVPDLHVFSTNKGTYWLELKICGNKSKLTVNLSAPQVAWHEDYAKRGGVSWIVVYMPSQKKLILLKGRDAFAITQNEAEVVGVFSSFNNLVSHLEN